MKAKNHIVLRALNMVDGAVNEYLKIHKEPESGVSQTCWQSMTWLDDWFDRYYIGWDFSNKAYVVEWRRSAEDNVHSDRICVGVYSADYQDRTAKMIKKMIKQHKEDLKKEKE